MPASPVLVTGATGFIGREVTRCLLAMGRPVLALARGRPGEPARERVAAVVGVVADGRQLRVVEADLSRPGCDLEESDRQHLGADVETVIHCAGETTFFPEDMTPFRAGHIDGPLDLLRQLAHGRLRRWAHLSTAYVSGRRTGLVLEREGDVGQHFHNPYERVKLEAELAVRHLGARLGVDVRVLRPSIVVGEAPPTAGGSPSNLFFAFIRLAAALARHAGGLEVPLRIVAARHARFNIVPVDYVAQAAVALAEHPDGTGETCHLVVRDAPTQAGMLEIIAGRLGVRGLVLVDSPDPGPQKASPLERMVARMLSPYREYLEQDVQFDDTAARRLLESAGVAGATLSQKDVYRLIDQALVTPSPRPGVSRMPALNFTNI